jgi:hypothetical protein
MKIDLILSFNSQYNRNYDHNLELKCNDSVFLLLSMTQIKLERF